MIDHIAIQASDLDRSLEFYDTVLAPLGFRRVMEFAGTVGYGEDFPSFWVGAATDEIANRQSHLAFRASSQEAVRAFFAAATGAGAEVLHEPRLWPEYHAGYFGAFVRDPDGNNVEAVHHTTG